MKEIESLLPRFPPAHPQFLPTWHFVKSVRVLDDYSNYKLGTYYNGGNYSFHKFHDWFISKYPDGSWKFAYVERHTTSAEFSYDELTGSFQNDLGYLCLSNVSDKNLYHSHSGIEWIDGEKHYGVNEVLEKIATMSSFAHLWNEQYECIPSRWDKEDEGFTTTLSFSDKKAIITRLKELGVDKTSFNSKSSRPKRAGKGGGRRIKISLLSSNI